VSLDRELKDLKLDNINRILPLIECENKTQLIKWGIQTRSPFEWLGYVVEEVGELSSAISEAYYRDGTKQQVIIEATHAATLLLKIIEMVQESIYKEWKA